MTRQVSPLQLETRQIKHSLIVGQTGTGKSTLLETSANYYYSKGYKIVDLYNQDLRIEGAFFSLKADGFFKTWREKRGLSVRALPTRILLPMSDNLPNIVPTNYYIYTIPLNQLGGEELNILTRGQTSIVQEDILNAILDKIDKQACVPDLIASAKKVTKAKEIYVRDMPIPISDQRSLAGVIRPINALIRQNCVTSSTNPNCIDLVKELNDQKTVTVFHQGYLKTEELTMFHVVWLLRRIFELKAEGKIKTKVAILIREIGDLAPSTCFNKSQTYSKYYIDQIARKARSIQMMIIGDIQSPLDVSMTLKTQVGNLFVFRLTNREEIKEIKVRFRGDIRKEEAFISIIPSLKAGHCLALTSKGNTKMAVIPPSTMHRYEGVDFIKKWKKQGGEMKSIKEVKKAINEEWKVAVKQYKQAKKEEEKEVKETKETWESKILKYIKLKKKCTTKQIIDTFKLSKSFTSQITNKLIKNSTIKKEKDGRKVMFYYIQ